MIDLDIYCTNQAVEEFLQSLKLKLNRDYPSTKIYISTVNPHNYWLKNLYNFYNNTRLMEEKNAKSGTYWS